MGVNGMTHSRGRPFGDTLRVTPQGHPNGRLCHTSGGGRRWLGRKAAAIPAPVAPGPRGTPALQLAARGKWLGPIGRHPGPDFVGAQGHLPYAAVGMGSGFLKTIPWKTATSWAVSSVTRTI